MRFSGAFRTSQAIRSPYTPKEVIPTTSLLPIRRPQAIGETPHACEEPLYGFPSVR